MSRGASQTPRQRAESDDPADQIFWGDLHGHSMFHGNHSQGVDYRRSEWRKGLSCGTPADCYGYARDIALLDFASVSDQGACLNPAWPEIQATGNRFNQPGAFVTFRGYEAGVLEGHRNVYFESDNVEPSEDPQTFGLDPDSLYRHYAGRTDVLMIPHHVKVWTNWDHFDPSLEPVMEVYSSWGQSESPDLRGWEKSDHAWRGGLGGDQTWLSARSDRVGRQSLRHAGAHPPRRPAASHAVRWRILRGMGF